ncbi:LysR family transcriptional regulator [Dactylosporangium sp. NPDC051484]|uniref:LysR family transcriptional regulator n=1 Tax=Dactylosporangium sp. NPDC051484 TaxID=3154942 RepID=UPI00344CB70B
MDAFDLRSLSRFVTIAEHKSFRSAAKALFVAQPTLSKQMARLEANLGVQLFDRGRWGLRLTHQGELLLVRARRLLDDVNSLQEIVDSPGEVLRIGAAANATGSFLAAFLGQWLTHNRDVQIRFVEDGAAGLRERLLNRECDLAILAAPLPTVFDRRFLRDVAVLAALPKDHPLAGTDEPLRVSELAHEPLLLKGEPFIATELFNALCRQHNIEPEVVCESSVGQTLAALAENGLGIAVMADTVDLRQFDLPKRYICSDDGQPLTFTLFAAWHKQHYVSPRMQSFIDGLEAHFTGARAEGPMTPPTTS